MRKKILFITPASPFPPDSGGAQRSFLLYQSLALLGDVETVLLSEQDLPADVLAVLRADFGLIEVIRPHPGYLTLRRLDFGYGAIAVNVLRLSRLLLGSRNTLFESRKVAARIKGLMRGARHDIVVGRYLWPLVQCGVLGRAATFVDFDDLESEVWQSRADDAAGTLLKTYYRRISQSYAKRQRRLASMIAGGWVAKARDVERLPGARLGLLPNIPFANYPSPGTALDYAGGADLNLLGVAIFDYPPNFHGFDWLVCRVWPRLHQQFPRAKLNLVGRLSDPATADRWRKVPGVVLHGRVPELKLFYEKALFAVAPIFFGGGTNIKVIEALAYGRACVGTPHALKGFEGLDGLREGADEESFLASCVAMLQAPDQCLALGIQAAEVAAKQYSFDGFAEAVRAVVDGRADAAP